MQGAAAAAANETTTSSTKRPRRKKTFAELKEEESCLVKDRTHLKKELDTIRVKLEEQRSINERLKRIKLDLHAQSELKSIPAALHEEERNYHQMEASTSTSAPWNSLKQAKPEPDSLNSQYSCPGQNEASFVLPDLNMMPEEEGKPVGMR